MEGGPLLFPMSFSDLSPEQEKVVRVWTFLSNLSWFFLTLTLLLYAVLLLYHPDVVASFRRRSRASERPDQL